MEIDTEQWTRVIAKLIVDTRNRKVQWELFSKPSPKPTESGFSAFVAPAPKTYLASIGGQGFKFEKFEPSRRAVKNDDVTYRLAISTSTGAVLRVIPVTSGLADLSQAIEDQVSRVDEFVKNFLSS